MQNSTKIWTGANLVPQNTTSPSVNGDLRYNSSTNKVELFNGAVDPLVTESDTATLTNKTISGSSNTINNVSLTSGVSGTLSIGNGGTNATTANAGFANLSPMTTLGDTIYENATPTPARLAGNTSTTTAVLTQTGNGTISAAPIWTTTTGTGSVVLASAPTLTNPVVGTQVTTDNTTKAASTAYVTTAITNAIAGVNPSVAVQAATTAAGDTSGFTYNNGVSGIGATFTGTTNTAVTIDGFTFTALGQRLLVKNDTQSPSGAFNGVYYVTQLQTLGLPPIFTRALDYDTPSDINNTGAIPVVNGTVNSTTSWLLTSTVNTVGTDPLTYIKFSSNPSTVLINPMTTGGDIIIGGASGTPTRLANGTSGQVLMSNGGTSAETWATLTAPTKTLKTSTGSQAGLLFTISTTSTVSVGDTYKDNAGAGSNTYTVLIALTAQSGQVLYMSGTGTSPVTPLAKQTGAGGSTASISFSATTILASYVPPTGTNFMKVFVVGGGGGGGGTAGGASSSGGGAGGGGGGSTIKYISSPSGTYYYAVGSGGNGGSAGNNSGIAGTISTFLASNLGPYIGNGGGGGAGSAAASITEIPALGSTGGVASNGDLNIPGGPGSYALVIGGNLSAVSGLGGTSLFAESPGAQGNTSATGNAGTGYGGGGNGGISFNNGGSQAGGNGSAGLVLIEEFYQ